MIAAQNLVGPFLGTTYCYETLKHVDSFRLVVLLPGEPTDMLRCRLREVRMSSFPKFEALSYTWGTTQSTHQIREVDDDTSIAITQNLHSALTALRYPDKIRIIFIDAICINQNSLAERAHQVAQMGNIYSIASLVVAWLGTDDQQSAIRSLQHIAGNSVDCGIPSVFPISNHVPTSSELHLIDTVLKECDLPALCRLFANSWFERVWIIQELLLAQDVTFYSGHCSFTYKELSQASSFLGLVLRYFALRGYGDVESLQHLFSSGDFVRVGGTLQMREQRLYKRRLRTGNLSDFDKLYINELQELPLAVYCATLIQYKCLDPRDRVYGMLGLAQNGLQICPNYESTPQQVFTDLALKSLTSGDLSVLHHGGIRGIKDAMQMPMVPTFVADYDDMNIVLPYLGGIGIPRYNAGSRVMPYVKLVSYDAKTLPSIRARVVSSVEHTIHVGRNDTFLIDYADVDTSQLPPQFTISLGALHDVYDFCKRMSANKGPVYAEGFDTAFALTVVGNNAVREASWLGEIDVTENNLLNVFLMHRRICNRPEIRDESYMSADDVRTILFEIHGPLDEGTMKELIQYVQSYHTVVRGFLGRRTVFVTPQGYLGLGPNSMLEGDIVVVFEGGETPFILRPVQGVTIAKGPVYYIVGDCYLHGWMNGEALSDEVGILAQQVILM